MSNPDPQFPEVLAPCRRGSDKATAGQSCQSKTALRLSPEGSPSPSFRCVRCGHTWTVPLGGSVLI